MSSYSGGISTPAGGRQQQGKKPPRPPRSKLPALPGTIDPSTGKVTQIGDQFGPDAQRRNARRRREILRRQRLLAGAGFQVVPDGVWGPRSQTAWNRYLRNRSVVTKKSPQDKLDLTEPGTAPTTTNDKREQNAFRREQARRKAELALKKQIADQRAAILNRAASLRRDPTLAKDMTLRQIADVLVDREVDYHPDKNVNLTKALQIKLVARGYKVKIDGHFNVATANALKKAEAAEVAAEKKRQAAFLADRLYGSGEIKPGDTPAWWGFGAIPTKDKLLATLQEGGFSADLMFQQLLEQVLSPNVGWRAVQAQNLARIANTLQPGGAAATTSRLTGDASSVPLWMYLVDIIGVQDFVPFGDYSLKAGVSEEWRLRALQERAKHKDVLLQNAATRSATIGQAMALMGATSPQDFKEKMFALSVKEEAKFKQLQQSIASQDASWWGDAISSIFWVGEQARTGIASGLINPLAPQTAPAKQEQAERAIQEMNPVLRFAFEITFDPLNLVAPARFASAGAALSLRAFGRGASLGRYVVVGEGLSKALVYQKGTWSKLDVASRLISADDPFRITDSQLGKRVEELTRRLSVTKDKAMLAVSKRLKQAHRFGWKNPTFSVAGKRIVLPKFGSKLANEWLAKTDIEMAQMLQDAPVFKRLVATLKSKNASLYSDFLRGPKSQYGAALSGHLGETFRPLLVAHLALSTANDAYKAKLAVLAEQGVTEGEMRAAIHDARIAAQEEYTTILRGFGTFRAGGANPALSDWAGRNLQKELADRVAALQEQVESMVFPAIQDALEKHADDLLRSAKAQHALSSDTVRAAAKPVTHGGEQDFLRYAENGEAGYSFVTVKGGKAAVFRAGDGSVRGHALVGENGSVRVFVDPSFRRKGVATELYQTLSRNGVPVENLSGKGAITTEGAEFFAGRRAKMAGLTEHPLWDDAGNWRHAGAVDQGDLVRTIRESFERPVSIKNHRFGLGHTNAEMVAVVTRELGINVGRLDDYAARKIASGVITGAEDRAAASLAHLDEEERLIQTITGSWEKRADGFWYDTRETLAESNLYARHLDMYDKKLDFSDSLGEIDVLAVLGQAVSPADFTPLEQDLFNIGASMSGIWSTELAGTGFRTPGLSGALTQHSEKIRETLDRRAYALRLAEESALPKLLLEQGAVWRAFQYSQNRLLQISYKGLSAQLALWKFATLALRPAWAIRNHIDNVAKGFISGVHDPRAYIAGPASAASKKVASVLEQDIAQLRQLITFCDDLFGTNVGKHFDVIVNSMWEHSPDVLSRLFKSLDIEVPPEVLEMGLRQDIWDRSRFKLINVPNEERLTEVGADPSLVRPPKKKAGDEGFAERFKQGMWNVMGAAPENYMRRVIYRDEYAKALKDLADSGMNAVQIHLEATNRALQRVEDTLFDYSKISVAEDNLKVFFPFIQFWRKNSVFWIDSFATKPWLTSAVLHFDDDRREAHADLPMWMERYFHTDEIADALAVVPGLSDAFLALGLGDGAQFDPISWTSMAPFYRAFKVAAYGENQLLPSDRPARLAIVGAMLDSLNDWGLGMNPFFRKPLEAAGVANYRAWQRVFPQTALAEAVANASGQEGIARLVVSMEKVVSLNFPITGSNDIADNFDYWVQTVVAEQVASGEKPDIAKAEETIRDWFLIQNLWGYFGGIYWRRATPEDLYLSKLQDDVLTGHIEFDSLSSKDKKLLHLWSMRGMDRLTYDRYIALQPVIEAFFRGDNETKDKIKKENPEIIRWTDGSFTGHPVSQKFIRYAQRYVDQELYFQALEIADTLDVAPDVRQVAADLFLTPELKAYWEKNATPTRIRERMLQAEVRDYFNTLNKGYFAIPESDHDARDAFVEDHPELVRHWNKNNDPSDDYGAILGSAKADLRDIYFRVVQHEGWDGAASFLKQFPFMFEGTSAEKKVKDGEFIPGGGKWSAARIADFREAKPHLSWFFDTFMPKIGQEKAFKWLEDSDTERAKIILDYFKKYPSTKRLAYMKAAPWLKLYFGLPPAERGAWLRGGSEGAKIVLSFFEKYGKEQSQHATDFLEAKSVLDFYFKIPKQQRDDWLKSGDPRAAKVLAYFKKYGKQHQFERAFKKLVAKYPELAHGTPEQVRRMEFWKQYFAITPDQRPMFVLQEAENHGIFIYGEFGEKLNHDREEEYLRRGVGLGLSKRQSAFLFVKPLLEFYRQLSSDEKPLFVRANPELQWYFDNFSNGSVTGDKKLDPLVEQYFRLPANSLARSAFLRKHPEVQEWFDKRSSPAERAMRSLLTQYFALGGWQRSDFLLDHPEIQTFFDRRRIEKASELAQLSAFDTSDPRLRPFYEDAADLERAAGRMRAKLRQSAINRMVPDTIETRRERRPAA